MCEADYIIRLLREERGNVMPYLYLLDDAGPAYSTFISTVFNNIANTVKAIGSYAIIIIGIALIIMAVVQIAKGFVTVMKGGWYIAIGTLLFGGILSFGGWSIVIGDKFGKLGKDTLDTIMGIGTGNTPSTVSPISVSDGSTALSNAEQAISLVSDGLLTPFATALAVCVGIVMVVFAAAKIAGFFIGGGKSKTSWGVIAALAIMGSVLFTATPTDNSAGWGWLRDTLTSAVRDTVNSAVDGAASSQATDGESLGLEDMEIKPKTEQTDDENTESTQN